MEDFAIFGISLIAIYSVLKPYLLIWFSGLMIKEIIRVAGSEFRYRKYDD